MTTIPQNPQLLKHLLDLLAAHRPIFQQERIYQRVVALLLAEVFVFARHTITQLLLGLGQTEQDWSAWYRLFSQRRFRYEQASQVLLRETLKHVAPEDVYVVGGDGTQTPRSSRKLEGSGWLRNLRTPAFMLGIHAAQRWFNGSWLLPAEAGYSRAVPIQWLPAFTARSQPTTHPPLTEAQAALQFLTWLVAQLTALGRAGQRIVFVGDGSYDNLELWRALPTGVILLARSAKNRVLYQLPSPQPNRRGRKRVYGARAATPQQVWQARSGWQKLTLTVRGTVRHLQVKVPGAFVRQGVPHRPLMLIVVRGKHHARTRRDPLPFLVNAVLDEHGHWTLPLPLDTLLFWAWQRWELEVCHRELKAGFGLGDKQCFNPQAAVASVQWSAWAYAVLVLAGYRTFGLTTHTHVPTRWWRGSGRWSLNTLWRAYRACLWQQPAFHPLFTPTRADWGEKERLLTALRNAVFGAARA
jgi:hypothetical protein